MGHRPSDLTAFGLANDACSSPGARPQVDSVGDGCQSARRTSCSSAPTASRPSRLNLPSTELPTNSGKTVLATANEIAEALAAFIKARGSYLRALTDLKPKLTDLAAEVPEHDHLDPIDEYREIDRPRACSPMWRHPSDPDHRTLRHFSADSRSPPPTSAGWRFNCGYLVPRRGVALFGQYLQGFARIGLCVPASGGSRRDHRLARQRSFQGFERSLSRRR